MCRTWGKYIEESEIAEDVDVPVDPNAGKFIPKKDLLVRPRCILNLEILENRKGSSWKTGDTLKTSIERFEYGVSINGKINRFDTKTKSLNFFMSGETIHGSDSVRGNLNSEGEIVWSNSVTSNFDGGLCSSDFKSSKPLARMCELRLQDLRGKKGRSWASIDP